MKNFFIRSSILVILLVGLLNEVNNAFAVETTITVDTTTDSNDPSFQACSSAANDCSLRGSISKANADTGIQYTIQVPAGIYTLTLEGSEESNNNTGDLDILTSLIIQGDGMDQTILQAGASSAEGIDRVIEIAGGETIVVEITNLTVRHGKIGDSKSGAGIRQYNSNSELTLNRVALRDNLGEGYSYGGGLFTSGIFDAMESQFTGNETGGEGGGIYQTATSNILLERCLIAGNTSGYGGGFANNDLAILINTTISENTANTNGGGISQWNDADLQIHYSTITDNINTASTQGWAINDPASMSIEIYNSIITAEGGNSACTSQVDAGHHNIGSDTSCDPGILVADPDLEPLADNGGDTLTHALNGGSPAIDAAGDGGNAIPCPTNDQREFIRPFDGNLDGVLACDIGAYEWIGNIIHIPVIFDNSE